ncbi:MAG TPA: hypothetical protein PLH70_01470 [Bacteroidales bacterium]|nr:hypothetical protein [Bacteroidales bacterium]HOH22222.1 hypothetical protein [Bacteroidales bacterium]HPB57325.1 hypothetical protein [Bacteroidales bacterium]HPZ02647.1 hypothetical protein [Bacteroidales bacterium]HQB74454.1 hypothetical protein [Bacteroidales bacterium]
MMKNLVLITLIFLVSVVFTVSCKDVKKDDSSFIESTEENYTLSKDTNQQVHFMFFDVISKYFESIHYYSTFQWVTSIYFAKKDSIDYFTIWSTPFYPHHLEHPDTLGSKYNYHTIEMNHTELVLITGKNNTDVVFSTFMIPNSAVKINSFDMEKNQHIIYDGRWFIESHQYQLVNGNLKVKKLEKPIVEFLGNPPEQFW